MTCWTENDHRKVSWFLEAVAPTVEDVEVSYYNPREFVIFFRPISVNLEDDEYISSIHITAEADIPDNSTVEFLMTQSNSLRP